MPRARLVLSVTAVVVLACCSSATPSLPPFDGGLAIGTWGGDSVAIIVGDTATHIHVGCTYGDISGRIPLTSDHFDVAGSYMLRAFPVAVGPAVPARFVGDLAGTAVRVTITVDDTVQKQTIVLGPVTASYGEDPRLMPCPICKRPDLERRHN